MRGGIMIKRQEETFWGEKLLIILIVMTISWVYTCTKNYPVVHFNYVHVCQPYVNYTSVKLYAKMMK